MNWVGLVIIAGAIVYGIYLILNRKAEGERARRRLERGGRLGTPGPPGEPARQAAGFGVFFVIVGLAGVVFALTQGIR